MIAMSNNVIHGFAWFTYPATFGLEDDDAVDPGHPFASSSGSMLVPDEVLYHRPVQQDDAGILNPRQANSYLVLTRTLHHPRVCDGWDSDPAALTGTFKSADGRVKITR